MIVKTQGALIKSDGPVVPAPTALQNVTHIRAPQSVAQGHDRIFGL